MALDTFLKYIYINILFFNFIFHYTNMVDTLDK